MTAVTVPRFAQYVNADASLDAVELEECLSAAVELVDRLLTGATAPPESVKDRAVLESAADLYARKNARTGVPSFESELGVPEPYPVLRDPKASARVILQQWLTPAIG